MLVVRHGQSEWNAAGRWQGWADIDLTELGQAQARHAANRLNALGVQFERVVASDLRRAQHTAELLSEGLALGPVVPEPQLREFDVGHWSGLTRAEIEERWPGQLEAWWRGALTHTPGGELRTAFSDRVVGAVVRLASEPGDTLAVAHGGVVGVLQVATCVDDDRPRITNLAGRWFSVDSRGQLVAGDLVYLIDAQERTASPTR